ncbi:MAG: class I mannose-6-phosphate isomerase [Clostridia bacterium]|jgi:mannose-6-phosphate isomerase|nr:class I mannose-6-phosphate isomerase [Clostridia bacterium]
MEPIFFKPSYKNVIWGGNNISKIFKRNIIGNDIGESWELSAHPNGLSIIKNPEYNGENLNDLFNDKNQKVKIFGKHCESMERFPILTKFIDASQNLSIQVHPDNEYAKKYENDSGKTEVWYIMDCKENAKIVYGFKDGITKDNLQNAVDNIEENVNYLPVHKGDFISIPSGTVHAIMDGIVLCEVQQSSDVTYRVYDWNRVDKNGKPRELHKEKALEVIDLSNEEKVSNYEDVNQNTNMYKSDVFNIDMININGENNEQSNEESFYAYIVIEGKGNLKAGNFFKEIEKGDTFLIPANLGKYTFLGNMKLMKIWV